MAPLICQFRSAASFVVACVVVPLVIRLIIFNHSVEIIVAVDYPIENTKRMRRFMFTGPVVGLALVVMVC